MAILGFGEMIGMLKKNPKKIVFTEGTDSRILEAASRLLASNFLSPILVGDEDEIFTASEECGYNIRGAEIIDPKKFDGIDKMAEMFCELRKSKGVTTEEAKKILLQLLKHAEILSTVLDQITMLDIWLNSQYLLTSRLKNSLE